MDTLLEIKNLSKSYDNKEVLKNIFENSIKYRNENNLQHSNITFMLQIC